MSNNKLDMSLDEIISIEGINPFENLKKRNESASSLNKKSESNGNSDDEFPKRLFKKRYDTNHTSRDGTEIGKLFVSNLFYGVTDADLKELFGSFGELKSVNIKYRSDGSSSGMAYVHYLNKNDAIKAMDTLNHVPLDGRTMFIKYDNGQNNDDRFNARDFGNAKRYEHIKSRPTVEELDADLESYLNNRDKKDENCDGFF